MLKFRKLSLNKVLVQGNKAWCDYGTKKEARLYALQIVQHICQHVAEFRSNITFLQGKHTTRSPFLFVTSQVLLLSDWNLSLLQGYL
uniref:Uncharacterized protein n=1 Tax=Manihot esculenta TaxID=3983 RepID=A0A2C9WRZ8_MANES